MARGVRALLIPAALLVFLTASLAGFAQATRSSPATAKSSETSLDFGLLEQLNTIRAEHGLIQLNLNPKLTAAALTHSREMLADGYFGHDSPNGSPFWKRIQVYYPAGHFDYWSVGENLYWASGSTSARAGIKAWMASPEHRANILDPAWREIGIAAASAPDAPGTFAGLHVTVITTDFGVRR